MTRRLGFFLLIISVYQIAIYAAARSSGDRALWLFYVDPRIGLFFVESALRHHETFPAGSSWVSAAVLGVMAAGLVRNPIWLRAYLVVEAVMAAPTVLMFILTIAANLSSAHGLSIGELFVPLLVFLIASVAPFVYAFRSWKRLANVPLQPMSGA